MLSGKVMLHKCCPRRFFSFLALGDASVRLGAGSAAGGGVSDASDRRGGLMAVHYLVLSCFLLFSLNTLFGVDRLFKLSLNHQRPRWWQSVTSL